MPQPPAISKFRKLVDDISRLYENARRAQVAFAWETGRAIVEVEQDGAVRAQYGKGLLRKLSDELLAKYGAGFSQTNLIEMRRFYLENKIYQPADKLTWTNHVALLRVKDRKVRKAIAQRAERDGLTKYEVRRIVREVNAGKARVAAAGKSALPGAGEFTPLKRPADLRLDTFAKSTLKNVKLPADGVLIDCGFCVNWVVAKKDLAKITVTDTPSYTYAATLERVVDGDTLYVLIEVGFGIIVRDKLRLRGIDTPELGTPAGERAKEFVEKLLPAGAAIVLKSHKCKTDTYGRFVADVFCTKGTGTTPVPVPFAVAAEAILPDGIYLNQQLLDEGYAVRAEE